MNRSIWMPRWGDINGLFGLMLDNTAALVLLFTLLAAPDYRDSQFTAPFVMTWMIPGTVAGVLLGGILYALTAVWLGRRTGRGDITAMPVGLDTPSVIAMSLLVLLPALRQGHTMLADSQLEALELHNRASVFAWHVGAALLVMLGVLKLMAAPFAGWLRGFAPRAALLGSLAAVALALIAFIPMYRHIAPAPLVGLPVLMIVLLTLLAKRGVGDAIPGSVLALGFGTVVVVISAVLGVALNWHFVPLPNVSLLEGGEVLPLATDTWTGDWWNAVILAALEKLPVMAPFAFFTVLGGVQCTESAAAAGDEYDARGVTLVQGLASTLAGALGGVVQTTPYFGHPAYKQMGAGWMYAVVGTLILALAGHFGWFARFFEFMPGAVLFPIIIYVGLRTIAHSFETTTPRDYAAMALAALPVLAYLIVIAVDEIFAGHRPTYNGAALLTALRCLGNGFIITSFLWALALASVLERQPWRAVAALLVAAACSLFGLMHSPLPDAPLALPTDVWSQLAEAPNSQLQFMSPFHWCVGYLLTAGVVALDWLFFAKPVVQAPPPVQPGDTPAS